MFGLVLFVLLPGFLLTTGATIASFDLALLADGIGSGCVTNVLLALLAALALIRTLRRLAGHELLLDDDAYELFVKQINDLIEQRRPSDDTKKGRAGGAET